MKALGLTAGLLLGVATMASCRTPTSATTVESYPSNKVTINSKVLSRRLQVDEISITNRHDLLIAQIRARNLTQDNFMFEYRFRWLDNAGMLLKRGSDPWIPVNTGGREIIPMEQMAPNKEAADFIFEVRFRAPNTRWR